MRIAIGCALAMLALAGCVTAHIDYPLNDVKPHGRPGVAVSLELKDERYSDKHSVATFAHKTGTYNQGVEFSRNLRDYAEVFGGAGTAESWYIAPDRLYWKPSGPMEDLRDRLAEHLRRAGVLKEGSGEWRTASGQQQADNSKGRTLRVALKRFVALKARRPGVDTFGFFGVSAVARSREIVAVKAEWTLLDPAGRTLDNGIVEFVEDGDGSCWRAKNKPFVLNNRAARRLGDELVKALRP
ncbi:MAG: hypothetical protein IKO40_13295 [Kiritimatiellae bacterium]|nr:hypothetical protein [Kiritimatiellia bacterium]